MSLVRAVSFPVHMLKRRMSSSVTLSLSSASPHFGFIPTTGSILSAIRPAVISDSSWSTKSSWTNFTTFVLFGSSVVVMTSVLLKFFRDVREGPNDFRISIEGLGPQEQFARANWRQPATPYHVLVEGGENFQDFCRRLLRETGARRFLCLGSVKPDSLDRNCFFQYAQHDAYVRFQRSGIIKH